MSRVSHCRRRVLGSAAAAMIAVAPIPSRADGLPATGAAAPAAESSNEGNLLGDLGGLRSWLTDYGVAFNLSETSEVLGNLTGGVRTGAIYEGLTDFDLTVDFRHDDRWPGVFYARGNQIHGRGLSTTNLQNLDTVSSIEATRTTRLRELWYEHYFDDRLRLRVGQQTGDKEFIVSTTAAVLINGTFGWPGLAALDLPSGGTGYPLATPAARLRYDPGETLTILLGVYNGDPAGRGTGDPQRRDASGTAFRTSDGIFAIAEIQYRPGGSDTNAAYKLGAWVDTLPFADQRRDFAGTSLASPASLGRPRTHSGDFSVYGVVDQPLSEAADGGGANLFLRVMGAPGDRNIVDFYLDGGLAYRGPFGRPNDTFAIGVAYNRIGGAARGLDADTALFTGQPHPIRSAETLVELTYQVQVTPWLQVQPDLQYVINPGGGIPDPLRTDREIGDVLVLGLRTMITF